MPTTDPRILEGQHVRLEPLSADHHDGLCDVTRDGRLWELTVTGVPTPAAMAAWIDTNVRAAAGGEQCALAIRSRRTGQVVGTTSLLHIHPDYRRLEIGKTWIAASWQRTAVNTETKYLLLCHAFESLAFLRVQFITDVLNARSRAAIERLGAQLEGVVRHERVRPDGRRRDTALYSIIEPEWGAVKARLEARLTAAPAGTG